MLLDFEEVKKLLPQRYPIILIDRVIDLQKGESIVCLKNITGNEIYFLGHFPEKAIFPGALIIEGMAQAAIILFQKSKEQEQISDMIFLFASVKARFLKPVIPGDQLQINVKVIKFVKDAAIVEGIATVDGKVVAKSEMTFAQRPKNNKSAK